MKNKTIKKYLIVLTAIIAVALIAAVSTVVYLEINMNMYYKWKEKVKSIGPQRDEAIWISSDGNIYIVSKKNESSGNIESSAYIKVDGEWKNYTFVCPPGLRAIEFAESEPYYKSILSGDYDVVQVNQRTEMKITVKESLIADTYREEDGIVIQKYSYEDMINKLPFSISENNK